MILYQVTFLFLGFLILLVIAGLIAVGAPLAIKRLLSALQAPIVHHHYLMQSEEPGMAPVAHHHQVGGSSNETLGSHTKVEELGTGNVVELPTGTDR